MLSHYCQKRVTKVVSSYPPKDIVDHLNQQLVSAAAFHEVSSPKLPIVPNISDIIVFRKSLLPLKQTVSAALKIAQNNHDMDQMKHFIEQRCQDFTKNQSRMISSILN